VTIFSQSLLGVWRVVGDDLDVFAALQLVLERHELAVDARAGAVLADLRVHAVREVDDGRARPGS
jgi:hypothetical protein